jgi:regulatory protein
VAARRRPRAERPDAPPADPYEAARAIALRSLAQGPRTRQQLAQTLARRGVDEAVAEALLDRLEAVDLLDDAAYAQAWVRSRHDGRGLSRRALGQELRRRGVADDDAEVALAGLDSRAEEQRARELVDAKLPASRGLDVAVRTRRLVGMLARKGYPPGLATRVVREQLALEPDVDLPGRRFLDALDGPLSELAELGE